MLNGLTRSLISACALTALIGVGACGGDTVTVDTLFLKVTSDAIPDGSRVESLRILLEKDGARYPASPGASAFNPVLTGLDPAVAPVYLSLDYGGQTFGDGQGVRISVAGRSGTRVVATFEGQVDLGSKAIVEVNLRAVPSECDRDGDGFLDCGTPGCCEPGSLLEDCEPDNPLANPWGSEPECRSCGDTTNYTCADTVPECEDRDGDGIADCDEEECGSADDPTVGPGLPELCDGKDNSCDGLTDVGEDLCPAGQICTEGECVDEISCSDEEQNGDETDVDCGGTVCGPCDAGQGCVLARDCASAICWAEVCRAITCGDGIVSEGEECDTGAIVGGVAMTPEDGDGCSATCTIEPGWSCEVPAGQTASVCETECGDGIVAGTEACDTGALGLEDGCSDLCEVEFGWECEAADPLSPSVCTFVADQPPEPPVILTVTAGGEDVTGRFINITSLAATGTAEAGNTVRLYNGAALLATVTADDDGDWQATFTATPDGEYAVTARATNVFGIVSEDSDPVEFVVDTVPPAVSIASPPLTNNPAPTLSGTGETGALLTLTVGGATYTLTIEAGVWSVDLETAVPAEGTLALDLNGPNEVNATATDAAGNVGVAVPRELVIDTTPPTITIAVMAGDDTLNFAQSQVTLTISGTTTGAPNARPVTVTLNGRTYLGSVNNGAWLVAVPPADLLALADETFHVVRAEVSDLAGNVGVATRELFVSRAAPTITIAEVGAADVINAAAAAAGVTVSGTTTRMEDGVTVSVALGAATRQGTVADDAWSVTFTEAEVIAAGQGLRTITANGTNELGNPATEATRQVTIDTTPPTVSSISFGSTVLSGLPNAGSTTVTFTFSEVVEGFTASDITLTVTSRAGVSAVEPFAWADLAVDPADQRVYTATLTAKAAFEGTATVSVSASFDDLAGNPATDGATSAPIVMDTVQPTATLSFAPTLVNKVQTSLLTIAFSEPPAPFALGALVPTRGTLSDLAPASDDPDETDFTVVFTPEQDFEGTGSVVLAQAVTDRAGNPLVESVTQTLDIDTIAPTIAINAISGNNYVNAVDVLSPLTITGTVTGEHQSPATVTVTNPSGITISNTTPTVTGGTWSVTLSQGIVNGFPNNEGTYTVRADISDAAGNPAPQATRSFIVDVTPPVVTLNSSIPDDLLTSVNISDDQTLSGVVTGATGAVVTVRLNGTSLGNTPTHPTTGAWTRTVPSATLAALPDGEHTFTADTVDAAGNPAEQASVSFTKETTLPNLAITYETPSGEPLTALTIGQTGRAVFTFDKDVEGFTLDDLTVTWTPTAIAPLSDFTQDGPRRYSALITPPADFEGTVAVGAGTDWTDLVGNPPGDITVDGFIEVDTLAPVVSVALLVDDAPATLLTIGQVATLEIVFSEQPVGFSIDDLTLVEATLTDFGPVLGDALRYVATFTPSDAFEGTASITVGTDWTDLAGNPPAEGAAASVTVDTLAPELTLERLARTIEYDGETLGLINAADAAGSITFEGKVTGIEAGIQPALTLDGQTYLATVTDSDWTVVIPQSVVAALSQGRLTVAVNVSDAAGNPAEEAARDIIVLTEPPTASVRFDREILNATSPAIATITFSTIPVGFDHTDLTLFFNPTVGIGEEVVPVAAGDLEVHPDDPTRYDVTVVGLPDFQGTVLLRLAADWLDGAGNAPTGVSDSQVVTVDMLRPTVTVSIDSAPPILSLDSPSANLLFTSTLPMAPLTSQDLAVLDEMGVAVPEVGIFQGTGLTDTPPEGTVWFATFTVTSQVELEATLTVLETWTTETGNIPTAITPVTISIDTVPPEVSIDVIGVNDRVGLAIQDQPLPVNFDVVGGAGVPTFVMTPGPGTDLSLSVTPVAGAEPGSWVATIPGAAVDALVEGVTYTVTVAAVDLAGNTSTETRTFQKDITPPTVTLSWDSEDILNVTSERVVTLSLSEPTLGLSIDDMIIGYQQGVFGIQFAGPLWLSDLEEVDPTTWQVTLRVPLEDGEADFVGAITVGLGTDWRDLAGNGAASGGQTSGISIDTIRPVASMTFELPEGRDYLNLSDPVATVRVELTREVVNLTAFSVETNGTGEISALTQDIEDPLVYTFTYTLTAAEQGWAIITLLAHGDDDPVWTDLPGNPPLEDVTITFPINPIIPADPTVAGGFVFTTGTNPQVITGTVELPPEATFGIAITRPDFTTRSYAFGATQPSGVSFTVNTVSEPATWTLTLTGDARLPRSTEGNLQDYVVTATVTTVIGTEHSGTGSVRVTNPAGNLVGGLIDERPLQAPRDLSAARGQRMAATHGHTAQRVVAPTFDGRWDEQLRSAAELATYLVDGGDDATDLTEVDTDGDGLSDAWEVFLELDPTLEDTDGDGILDGDEDSDGDGFSNLDEIAAGTDPSDPSDYPGALSLPDAEAAEAAPTPEVDVGAGCQGAPGHGAWLLLALVLLAITRRRQLS